MQRIIRILLAEDQRMTLRQMASTIKNIATRLGIVPYGTDPDAQAAYIFYPGWLNRESSAKDDSEPIIVNQTEIHERITELANPNLPDEERRLLLIFDLYVPQAKVTNLVKYVETIARKEDPPIHEQVIVVYTAVESYRSKLEKIRDHVHVLEKARGARPGETYFESFQRVIEDSLNYLRR